MQFNVYYKDDERCPYKYESRPIYGYGPSHDFECPHRLKMLKFQGSCATDIIKLMTYISVCCDAYQKINTCNTLPMSETKGQAHMVHMQQLISQLPHQVEFEFR